MSIDQLHELSQIADELRASANELAWRRVAVCRRFPSYDKVPDEDLHRSSRRRAIQGVPAEDVLACYWAVLSVLRDEFITRATAAGLPSDVVLAGTRRLWNMTERLGGVLMQARHEIDIELARHDKRTCAGQHFPALVGPIDGDLAGITCRRPSVNDDVTVLAIAVIEESEIGAALFHRYVATVLEESPIADLEVWWALEYWRVRRDGVSQAGQLARGAGP